MCKLIVGINNNPNNQEFGKVIQSQFEGLTTQPNGIGAAIITTDNQLYIFRQLVDYQAVFESVMDLIPYSRMVALHTRISTGGSKGEENIHFFEDANHLLAHNGIVSSLSYKGWGKDRWTNKSTTVLNEKDDDDEYCPGCLTAKTGKCKLHREDDTTILLPTPVSNPCDSLEFLQTMKKPATRESFAEDIDDKRLNGVAFLIKRDTLETFFATTRGQTYAITDKKDFGVFFSYKPDVEHKKTDWLNLFGVPVFDKETTTKITYPIRDVSIGTYQLTNTIL